MSFPHKEELIFIEQLANRQQRIYGDACDYGVYLSPGELSMLRANVKLLKIFYGGYNWVCNTRNASQSAVNNIQIPFEVENGKARGVVVSVNVVQEKGRTWASIGISTFSKPQHEVPCFAK